MSELFTAWARRDDLVRVDTLKPGQRFRDVLGIAATFTHVHNGAFFARRDSGAVTCYAGCAQVERI